MRFVVIPPYQNPAVNWGFVLHELVADLRKKGALEGIEVDVDEGALVESPSEVRDEEFLAYGSLGVIRKVKEYAMTGRYDAIVLTGAIDPGFIPARVVSKIPVVSAIHLGAHAASLIGERFTQIHTVAPSSLIIKHCVERYGFGHKLASVRFCGHSSTEMFRFLSKYRENKKERMKYPGFKKILDDTVAQCIAAIEKDGADTLLIGCEPIQAYAEEVRQKLNVAGYDEIPVICELPAGVAMARAMVDLGVVQVERAYPSAGLKAIPECW